ncbi:hypothetical protein FA95DRAFT_1242886 [Auriscalpium vulgare]|uniref:Uncharacterized protein n=1 Tax=Auriscalpium vulgare TaxID=40419 RepID=A0ACB8S8U6_9AGAM|nr:hypothetical protein FA95DRAFT_1242886 [Auriscalpium vulgare]
MSVASDGDGDNDADPQEVVSNTEIRRQLLDVAQGKQEYQRLDLDDVTWLDAPDSGDEGPLRIREVDSGPGKGRMPQQEALDVVMPRKRKGGIDKQLKERMEHWAKEEGSLRHTGGTGRGGAGASVTGLSKAKPVGAVKDGRAQPSRAGSGGQRQDTRKPVRKTASVLSAVSDRRARFEGHN